MNLERPRIGQYLYSRLFPMQWVEQPGYHKGTIAIFGFEYIRKYSHIFVYSWQTGSRPPVVLTCKFDYR